MGKLLESGGFLNTFLVTTVVYHCQAAVQIPRVFVSTYGTSVGIQKCSCVIFLSDLEALFDIVPFSEIMFYVPNSLEVPLSGTRISLRWTLTFLSAHVLI